MAKGQSGILYLKIVSLYHLGVHLTCNPFDATSPLLALRGMRGAKILNFIYIIMASSKKSCYPTALELSFNDEQISTSVEHWPRPITLKAQISENQRKPLTKVSPFFMQKSIQELLALKNM